MKEILLVNKARDSKFSILKVTKVIVIIASSFATDSHGYNELSPRNLSDTFTLTTATPMFLENKEKSPL